MTLLWTVTAVVAAIFVNWRCYRWGRRDGYVAGVRSVSYAPRIPHPERTDGKLLRATPAEIDAYFGPRAVRP